MTDRQKIENLESRLNLAAEIVKKQNDKIVELFNKIRYLTEQRQRKVFEDCKSYDLLDIQSDIGALIDRIEKIEKNATLMENYFKSEIRILKKT